MRIPFNDVFTTNSDGSYSPKDSVRIGGVTIGSGVAFRKGVVFSGVEIVKYVGHDLDVTRAADGMMCIEGVFD